MQRREDDDQITAPGGLADLGIKVDQQQRAWSARDEKMRQAEAEKDFFRRNCSFCDNNAYGELMIDRLANQPFQYECMIMKKGGTVFNLETRKKIVLGIGHSPKKGDCPKFKPIPDEETSEKTMAVADR